MTDKPAASGAPPFALPPGYDGLAEAKLLLRTTRSGALGTLSSSGFPMTTLVNVATDHDGSPLFLLSQLSAHTQNLARDPRASVLLSRSGKGDPVAHPRVTVVGEVHRIEPGPDRDRIRSRFLGRHPKAALYADFADFGFFRMNVEMIHLNGGFAKAADFDAAAILARIDDAGSLLAAETDAVEHLNNDHSDALSLYAQKLAGEPAARWRAIGLDPEGLDLSAGDLTARIVFPHRVTNPGELRSMLVELAKKARDG